MTTKKDQSQSKPEPISTIKSLHSHLQTAIELEHATIPAYLTAMYSIKEGSNDEAALVIRSVVVEEMLHLTLAANVMNAVGGSPSIDGKKFVPSYPTRLPHSANRFLVALEKFSPAAIETFMRIEHPAYGPDPQPEPDEYHTIGQFYEAILDGIDTLCRDIGEKKLFKGNKAHQITPEQYYGSGGRLIVVTDKDTAHAAINEIIVQGEGHGSDIWEDVEDDKALMGPRDQVAHFYRFDEIRQGRFYKEGDVPGKPRGDKFTVDWDAVWPITPNTKSADFPKGSEIRAKLDEFNRFYTTLLHELHRAFNGEPGVLGETIPRMYDLRYKAQAIARIPLAGQSENVGLSWERVVD